MLQVNLLGKPGLQILQAGLAVAHADEEAAIIDKLESRVQKPEPVPRPAAVAVKAKGHSVRNTFILLLIAFFAWFVLDGRIPQAIRFSRSLMRQFLPPQQTVAAPAMASPATMMANFITGIPAGANVEFAEVEQGVLIYRLGGVDDKDLLSRAVTQLTAHQKHALSKAMAGGGHYSGTILFRSLAAPVNRELTPTDYANFFDRLQSAVDQYGGSVVETHSGKVNAGEYVIEGSFSAIFNHLLTSGQAQDEVYYHRLTLSRDRHDGESRYRLRAIFQLIGGAATSQRASLPAATEA